MSIAASELSKLGVQSDIGRKDAVHVAVTYAVLVGSDWPRAVVGGTPVLVTAANIATPCSPELANGFISPFVQIGSLTTYDIVPVMLKPECITAVRHAFDIREVSVPEVATVATSDEEFDDLMEEADDEDDDECRGCDS